MRCMANCTDRSLPAQPHGQARPHDSAFAATTPPASRPRFRHSRPEAFPVPAHSTFHSDPRGPSLPPFRPGSSFQDSSQSSRPSRRKAKPTHTFGLTPDRSNEAARSLARYRPVAVGRTYLSKSSFSIPSPAPSMHFTNARDLSLSLYIYIYTPRTMPPWQQALSASTTNHHSSISFSASVAPLRPRYRLGFDDPLICSASEAMAAAGNKSSATMEETAAAAGAAARGGRRGIDRQAVDRGVAYLLMVAALVATYALH